jgi:hypothetical protein
MYVGVVVRAEVDVHIGSTLRSRVMPLPVECSSGCRYHLSVSLSKMHNIHFISSQRISYAPIWQSTQCLAHELSHTSDTRILSDRTGSSTMSLLRDAFFEILIRHTINFDFRCIQTVVIAPFGSVSCLDRCSAAPPRRLQSQLVLLTRCQPEGGRTDSSLNGVAHYAPRELVLKDGSCLF